MHVGELGLAFASVVDAESGRTRRGGVVVRDGIGPLPDDLVATGSLVLIDDGPGRALDADLIVNPNVGETSDNYVPRSGGSVLAGAAYAIVRDDLHSLRDAERPGRSVADRLLITCGAADPSGMTERYLGAVGPLVADGLRVRVALGSLNPRRQELERLASELGVVAVVGQTSLREQFEWTDIALTTLGTTATELAYLGIPNLAAACQPEQRRHLEVYASAGLVVPLGWHAELDSTAIRVAATSLLGDRERREALAKSGRATIDGLGATRIAEAVLALVAAKGRFGGACVEATP